MGNLAGAAAFFLAIHLLVSGTRVRDVLTARIGENAYMGLFSLASVAGIVWLSSAYGPAARSAANPVWWGVTPAARHIQILLQLAAVILVTGGLLTRNPTSVRQEGALERPDVVQGFLRVTRHPFLWGVALWAAGHLLVNGDGASLVLFGSILVLALAGTASIDAKRRRKLGQAWDGFAGATSNIPFAAVLAGRQKLDLREIGLVRPGLGLLLWAALLMGHGHIFGVPALG